MKKDFVFLAIALVLAGIFYLIYHPVVLNWQASPNGGPAVVYNVYRASSACPVNGNTVEWKKIISTSALTYTDRSIKFGTFCYVIRASVNGRESPDSNYSQAVVVPTWRH